MVGIKNNKQAQHTKKALQENVLQLLQKKSLSSITVTEVCQRAHVNRTTFYRYFDDIYMCVDKIESEFLDGLDMPKEISPGKALQRLLEGFYANPQISNLVFIEGETKLLEKMHKSMEQGGQHLEPMTGYQETYIMLGMQGIMKRWVKNGMPETPEELTKIIIRVAFADDLQSLRSNFF
ncbi:TetR/AcrR family transcriptional regulator [Companilactobacillus futsaii]|uniref:TetR/AcrR family transcriptional regulator n=2 Tax=Companilactobacillus futsaii TaxID=938155 RepID=A0A5B7T1F0_9LACO|nr:TetR/AcrR family transcriptional regulator [Companilactobacillus futsaii]KRK91246.1 putative transcription regulator (putative) [Companilactobacillus futsaii JCM 17355]QCX25543.1 TetR/AcrR family transcriptional regulator [Companilactobacillus futsaii]